MNIADELAKLKQLHDSGALSDEEFSKAKQAVLDHSNNQMSAAKESVKPPGSIADHLLRKAAPPASPPPVQPTGKAHAKALAYAPVAPTLATLEPDERHHYTFTVSPYLYKQASFFPPRLTGWYPDFTRFIWHLTDRRILIEPHELTTTENTVMKGLFALSSMNLGGKIASADVQEQLSAGQQELHEMRGHWLALAYDEIAAVEQQQAPRYQFIKLARVVFRKPGIEPLVVGVNAGIGSITSMNWHSAEFIRAMTELLTRESVSA